MELFLLNTEFQTERTLPNYRDLNIGYIRLPINDPRAKMLLDSFGIPKFKFTIVVRNPSAYPPMSQLYVRFSNCVNCGHGIINGVEDFQINFWEHKPLDEAEKRDFILDTIIN